MSELIQQLAKQATIRVNNPFVDSYENIVCDNWEEGISISKFADLVANEVFAELARQLFLHCDMQASDPGYQKAMENTLKKFRVSNG
jgi:hypothetical protein